MNFESTHLEVDLQLKAAPKGNEEWNQVSKHIHIREGTNVEAT